MTTTIPLNLAAANHKIQQYLRLHKMMPRQKQFLQGLQRQIQQCHLAQRSWLMAGGILATANPAGLAEVTQETILKEAEQALAERAHLTKLVVQNIKQQISDIKLLPMSSGYQSLLSHIEHCCDAVFETAEKDWQYTTGPYRYAIFKGNKQGKLITHLGGRYIPFTQNADPLRGKQLVTQHIEQSGKRFIKRETKDSDGYCRGYARTWSRDIEMTGRAVTTPCLDDAVYKRQKHQMMDSFSVMLGWRAWRAAITAQADFKKIMNNMFEKMDAAYVYTLVLDYKKDGHALGVRRIPGTETVEIFDPNFGIVVFDSRKMAEYWLAQYLAKTYFDKFVNNGVVCGGICLIREGRQPAHAAPSIPKIAKLNHLIAGPWSRPVTLSGINEVPLKNAGFLRRFHREIIIKADVVAAVAIGLTILGVAIAVAANVLLPGVSVFFILGFSLVGVALGAAWGCFSGWHQLRRAQPVTMPADQHAPSKPKQSPSVSSQKKQGRAWPLRHNITRLFKKRQQPTVFSEMPVVTIPPPRFA